MVYILSSIQVMFIFYRILVDHLYLLDKISDKMDLLISANYLSLMVMQMADINSIYIPILLFLRFWLSFSYKDSQTS
jgi:hypothetical protein